METNKTQTPKGRGKPELPYWDKQPTWKQYENDRAQGQPRKENAAQFTRLGGHSPLPCRLEQANGQTTIYDAGLNILFRAEGRHFDALEPIVRAVNNAEAYSPDVNHDDSISTDWVAEQCQAALNAWNKDNA